MKRLFVLGLAIMAFGASSFASGSLFDKLNNKTSQNGVIRYLDTTYQQDEDLRYIFSESSKRFDRAIAKGETEEVASKKAINFNLANAKAILSADQYRKYLTVLNITVNNASMTSLLAEK